MKKISRIIAVILATLLLVCSCGTESDKDSLTFTEKLEKIDLDNFSVSGAVSVEVSDEFLDMVGEGDSSFEMFKELGVNALGGAISFARNKDLYSLSANALVNNQNIIEANAVVDVDRGDLYLSVPDVNKTALKIGLDDLGLGDLYYALDMFKGLTESKGAEFDFDLLMELYADTYKYALQTLPKPDKSNFKMTVMGVSQNVQAVKYTVEAEDLKNTAIKVMDMLVNDKRFKKLSGQLFPIMMSALEEYVPEMALFSNIDSDDFEELYDQYVIPAFDEIKDELEEEFMYEDFEPIEFTYYLAGDDITGFDIYSNGQYISMHSATSGGKVKAEVDVDGMTVASFSGTEKGGLISGTLDVAGSSVKIEDFDSDALAKGIIRLTVVLDSSLLDTIPEGVLVKFKADMDFLTSNLFSVEMYQKNKRLLRCVFGLSIDEGSKKASLPKKTSNNIEGWAMDCVDGLDSVVDNLSKAGIKKQYISQLKTGLSMLEAQSSQMSSMSQSSFFGY